MGFITKVGIALGAFLAINANAHAELLTVKYEKFTVILDCATKSAVAWSYTAGGDTNNYDRHRNFYFNDTVPSRCQQTSQDSYKAAGDARYHRGHLVPANAMDSSELAIAQSNDMINVLPQVAQMNTGAWYQTELWVECRRDEAPVSVFGGVYKGITPKGGNFLISHGIKAPEAFWKVAQTQNEVIAWWVPNSVSATEDNIDNYITSVAAIEEKAGVVINVPSYFKSKKAAVTNAMLTGCKKS